MNHYLTQTARCFEIAPASLVSNKRNRNLVDARAAYAMICRTRSTMSVTEIGNTIGKDHSTVSHYLKNIHSILEVRQKYEALCRFIDNPPTESLIDHLKKRREQRKKLAEWFANRKY